MSDRQRVESEVRIDLPEAGVSVIRLIGEHDLSTKSDISDAIGGALDAGREVAVDLSEADFIDSSTLHALVAAARRAAESGRGFSLVIGGNEIVRQVFELTGLDSQFETAPSVDAALAGLRSSGDKERQDQL